MLTQKPMPEEPRSDNLKVVKHDLTWRLSASLNHNIIYAIRTRLDRFLFLDFGRSVSARGTLGSAIFREFL